MNAFLAWIVMATITAGERVITGLGFLWWLTCRAVMLAIGGFVAMYAADNTFGNGSTVAEMTAATTGGFLIIGAASFGLFLALGAMLLVTAMAGFGLNLVYTHLAGEDLDTLMDKYYTQDLSSYHTAFVRRVNS